MDRAAWIAHFSVHLVKFGVRGSPLLVTETAARRHETEGHLDPAEIAKDEADQWLAEGE